MSLTRLCPELSENESVRQTNGAAQWTRRARLAQRFSNGQPNIRRSCHEPQDTGQPTLRLVHTVRRIRSHVISISTHLQLVDGQITLLEPKSRNIRRRIPLPAVSRPTLQRDVADRIDAILAVGK